MKNWNCELISENEILKFGMEALKKEKLFASDILEEISQYNDPDVLETARENNLLNQYCRFENTLSEILFEKNYSEGDVCDEVWKNAWDFFTEIVKSTES